MAKVLFERVKTETGLYWHTDKYACSVVKNPLYYLSIWNNYVVEIELDSADAFVIYKDYKRPYYKMIKYILNDVNIIPWLKDNITGVAGVRIYYDHCGDPDFKGSPIIAVKRLTINFASSVDAMAFKMSFMI